MGSVGRGCDVVAGEMGWRGFGERGRGGGGFVYAQDFVGDEVDFGNIGVRIFWGIVR